MLFDVSWGTILLFSKSELKNLYDNCNKISQISDKNSEVVMFDIPKVKGQLCYDIMIFSIIQRHGS